MKKGIFLLLLIGFSSHLFAQQYNNTDNTFVVADILIWKLREGGADNWGQEISPAGNQQSISLLNVPFKWSPGYRIGIGRNKLHDCWDTAFYYTFFKTNGLNQAAVTSGGIYSAFLGNFYINNTAGASFGPNYRSANIQWKFIFNVFDLELGRAIPISPLLKLRPFIGIKAGIINQHISTNWQNPNNAINFTSASENVKNNFKGIGPAIGLDTNWYIYNCQQRIFKIFGNFSGALLAGHWSFQDVYENNAPMSDSINSQSFNSAAPMARGVIGIEWDTCLYRANMKVRLGYEAQVWFNQLRFYLFNAGRLDHLFSLQGGVLDFCFYF